jgi:hypothetical protein
MTSLVQESDPVTLSHEEIIEMYLVLIKIAADQNLNRKRTNSVVRVSPEVLKQLMDLKSKTKNCECCGCCGCCRGSDGVMAVAIHGDRPSSAVFVRRDRPLKF